MRLRYHSSGFTLVEVLVSTLILSAVLGTLFSVLGTLRSSANFRNQNLSITQATNFSFEQMVRSIKAGDAVESIWDPTLNGGTGGCQTTRGFYVLQNGQVASRLNPDGTQPIQLNTQGSQPVQLAVGQKLVTIQKEKVHVNGIGQTYRYIKKEYSLGDNDADASGQIYPTVIETTYEQHPAFAWPVDISAPCNSLTSSIVHWNQSNIVTRKLTANSARVTRFTVRTVAPQIDPNTFDLINSPYITFEITAAHPTDTTVAPMTLRSTITPTFAYGDQRE